MVSRRESSALQALGRRVRALRHERGYSQERLADEAQLHRTYISQVERGERNLAVLNVLRLAAALGVDPGQLVQHLDADAVPEVPVTETHRAELARLRRGRGRRYRRVPSISI